MTASGASRRGSRPTPAILVWPRKRPIEGPARLGECLRFISDTIIAPPFAAVRALTRRDRTTAFPRPVMASKSRGLSRYGLAAAMAMAASGCSTSPLPEIQSMTPPAATPVPAGQTAAAPPAGASSAGGLAPVDSAASPLPETVSIVGFRGSTVVLYRDERGNDGERATVSSLSLPMTGRRSAANGSRLEVATTSGPRWIARSEVVIGSR